MTIKLRSATLADADMIYAWQCEPSTRKYARNPDPPTRKQHAVWVSDTIYGTYRNAWIAEHEGQPVGLVVLEQAREFEVSLVVAPQWRGLGYSREMLSMLPYPQCGFRYTAEIHPENAASLATFAGAGFIQGEDGWWRREGP